MGQLPQARNIKLLFPSTLVVLALDQTVGELVRELCFAPGVIRYTDAALGTTPVGRQWAMNVNANGGPYNSPPAAPPYFPGQYGLEITPATTVASYYTQYRLGAKLSKFRSPAQKFLLVEHERTSDSVIAIWPYTDSPTVWSLGDSASYPKSSGGGGAWSFRHGGKAAFRGNFQFVDGHVESLTPKDEINATRRYDFSVW